MSFIRKAHEAAEAARSRVEEVASATTRSASDLATTERINRGLAGASQGARDAVGMAKRGVNTVIERIDPATLADLVIKATALQEMTNRALRTKGSPYRIAEISITASIPPGVSFTISRLDDEPEAIDGAVRSSSELVEAAAETGELVLALDGTTVDDSTATAIAEAVPGAMPPSTVSRS
ncbi:MAG: hypothetical protein ABIQ58_01965 [Candidatus Limnocylindrales bacterium]